MEEALNNQVDYYNEYAAIYKKEVAERYGLTVSELDEIAIEGTTKSWPLPPLP
jgi:hypothetical protein